jgi:hypothetical protein
MTAQAKEPRSAPPKELPAETTQARRFGKTRTAQSTALLEDYVELIADLLATHGEARPTDVARRLGVSHATAIKTIPAVVGSPLFAGLIATTQDTTNNIANNFKTEYDKYNDYVDNTTSFIDELIEAIRSK